jgi:hypothetical protein
MHFSETHLFSSFIYRITNASFHFILDTIEDESGIYKIFIATTLKSMEENHQFLYCSNAIFQIYSTT